ncbi:MAG TPA: class I SAM-dependent methyltransferase [Mycobacteriales bacterium]|nr:class I SAM-dependent methyltransferase [Mycobacteriales bacterium]
MDPVEIEALATIEDKHWWFAERRSVLERVLRDRRTGGWAADVGAAAGGNVRVLEKLGWRTLAFEYSEIGAELSKSRGLTVARADAHHLPLTSESMGAVTCLDVLEHLDDDAKAAAELRRILRPDGVLVVAVPADPALWSAHDEAVHHLRRYTRESLDAVLTGAGLNVQRLWSWNVLMRPLAAARRKRSTGSDIAQVPAPLNAALRGVVSLERVLPVGERRGVSLFAVCTPARG